MFPVSYIKGILILQGGEVLRKSLFPTPPKLAVSTCPREDDPRSANRVTRLRAKISKYLEEAEKMAWGLWIPRTCKA